MTSSQVRTFMPIFFRRHIYTVFLFPLGMSSSSSFTPHNDMPNPNQFYNEFDLLPITTAPGSSRNDNLYLNPPEYVNWDMTQIQEPKQRGAEETMSNQEQELENTKYSEAIARGVTKALLELVANSTTEGSPSKWPEVDRHEKAMVSKISAQLDWRGLLHIPPDHPASQYYFRATARRAMPHYPYDVSLWVHCSPADPAEVRRGRSSLVDQSICRKLIVRTKAGRRFVQSS
jgi:hypothetical protein